MPSSRRFGVQEQIAAQLHCGVGLVDLAAALTVLRMQIVSSGRVLATFDRRDPEGRPERDRRTGADEPRGLIEQHAVEITSAGQTRA